MIYDRSTQLLETRGGPKLGASRQRAAPLNNRPEACRTGWGGEEWEPRAFAMCWTYNREGERISTLLKSHLPQNSETWGKEGKDSLGTLEPRASLHLQGHGRGPFRASQIKEVAAAGSRGGGDQGQVWRERGWYGGRSPRRSWDSFETLILPQRRAFHPAAVHLLETLTLSLQRLQRMSFSS